MIEKIDNEKSFVKESEMKSLGEQKVWKNIKTKDGSYKNISSTQVGQQIIIKESLLIFDQIKDWVENKSAKNYRRELKNYFKEDQILLDKTAEVLLFLAGSINNEFNGKSKKSFRHKKINTVKSRILPELSFEVVWRFVEVLVDTSQYFAVDSLLNYDKQGFCWNLKYTCSLSETILEKLTLDAAESFYPLPMSVKPVDWSWSKEEGIKGGYTSYQYEMVRASREVDYSLYSQSIFNSINYIQSIPWKVNVSVLNQVKADLKMPFKKDYVKSTYPEIEGCQWDVDIKGDNKLTKDEIEKIKEVRKTFREKAELYNAEVGDFESAMGKYRAVKMACQVAQKYVGQTIYFPHSFDFRGRVYPIPIGLSPQGSDAVKAMLEYANGEPLDQVGAEWAFAYLASLYGDDKINFKQRVQRGMDLIDADYKDADEPYQFLAHQLELKKVLQDTSLPFYGRIHLDACNSGSQFTSAITGDKAGCEATNVIPTIDEQTGLCKRKDAYLLVSNKCLEIIIQKINCEKDKDTLEELIFFKNLIVENGRKVCKTPVMVSNYGGTAGGRSEILWNMFREMGVDRKWINRSTASRFSNIIGSAIKGVLNGGKAFETYIHKMNNAVTKTNNPIWWTTSDGFHIVHVKNKELKSKQVSCFLPGSRRKTTIIKKVFSDNICTVKMRSAISPNYIHSLDAELLRRVALEMKEQGIENSDWIHDSFGCHPNYVDEMLDITKNVFLQLMEDNPLQVLDDQLRGQMKSRKKRDKEQLEKILMPQLGGFDISKGDLDKVLQSEWFFS